MKASSATVASIFNSRRGGKDGQMVQRREQRKTQTGAGTGAQVVDGLEKVAASAIEMCQKDGADALTVTDAHAVLVNDVRERERFLAIPNNSNTHTSFGAWSPVHARARRADRLTGLPSGAATPPS